MTEKSLEERVAGRGTDQALALIAVETTTIICQLDKMDKRVTKIIKETDMHMENLYATLRLHDERLSALEKATVSEKKLQWGTALES